MGRAKEANRGSMMAIVMEVIGFGLIYIATEFYREGQFVRKGKQKAISWPYKAFSSLKEAFASLG